MNSIRTIKVGVMLLVLAVLIAGAIIFYKEKNTTIEDFLPIYVNPKNVNLNGILQHHEASTNVAVTNHINHSIQITDIRYSCGCTRYAIDKHFLKPNESTNLKITVNAENREGPFHVDLILHWKDLSNNLSGDANIEIKGTADSIFKLSKNIINFEYVDADSKEVYRQLTIKRGSSGVKWDNLEATDEEAHSLPLERLDANTFLLTYIIHPYLQPIGIYKDQITLEATSGNQVVDSEIQIPVSAQISSRLKLTPSCIYLGLIDKANQKTGNLHIRTTDGSPIKLVSFDSPPFLQVNLVEEGLSYLKFTYKSARIIPLGNIAENIIVTISTDKKRIIRIPVIAFVE
jgi:hypothetical protein